MEHQRFTADYGTLPPQLFSVGSISNPAELLRGEELYGLLRLCGIEEAENGAAASDWELFRSVGRALPMLAGHPMRARILQLLGDRFGIAEVLCEENCERLWRAAVTFAEKHPFRMEDVLPRERTAWLSGTLALPDGLPDAVSPVLCADFFLHTDTVSLTDWSAWIRRTAEEYRAHGGEMILLRLSREFSFIAPDPHHVGLALREKRRSAQSNHLLTAQLVREVCVICRENGMRLLIESACDGAICALLEYVKKSVGFPKLFATASDALTRDRLIECMKDASYSDVRLAVRLEDLPTKQERAAAWESIAARYPVGRLCVISGADLRMIGGVRKEIAEELARLY